METAGHNVFIPGETIVSPIVLMGPSSTGKSVIAKLIAETIGAEIVNADRFYTYANRDLCIGLGLMPGELDDGIPRHMYGIREPFDQPLAPDEYAGKAIQAIDEISSRGVPAVVEGCTLYYNKTLYRRYGPKHCVRLSWDDHDEVPERINARIRSAIDAGLYKETERAIDAGYEQTFPMHSYLFFFARRVLKEQNEQLFINIQSAIWQRMVLAQDNWYHNRTETVRMDVAADNRHVVAGKIIDLMIERS